MAAVRDTEALGGGAAGTTGAKVTACGIASYTCVATAFELESYATERELG